MRLPVEDFNRAAGIVTEAVDDLVSLGAATAAQFQDRDRSVDADRARGVVAGVITDAMRVAVVGEYKSGKSTLVNALVGASAVGTDPLASTTHTTEVRYGEAIETYVDLEQDGEWSTFAVDSATGHALALGMQPVGAAGTIRGIHTTVRAPLLASGLTFVDTPSVSGGITSATAASVLGELAQSQAWILVSDASQELTGPELELVKVGCALCPVVMLVQTKCDLTPHWRRISSINEQHLRTLDLEIPPVIIPTAAPLRDAAVRLGEPRLDHESGIPLLTWYLTRVTTVTSRASRARIAAAALAVDLEALEATLTGEIDLVLNSGERAEILEAAHRSRETCERLAQMTDPAVQRASRAFQREVHRDLQDRIESLRRTTLDDLAGIEGERDWPKIEQSAQAGVNRLFAEHLVRLAAAVDEAIEQVSRELSVASQELDVSSELSLPTSGDSYLTGQLDPPIMPSSGMSRLQPALVGARVGVTGAAGASAATALIGGALAVASIVMVPVAAVGAGWWVRQRTKESEAVPWKRQAEIELNRFINDCQQLIARSSEDASDEVLGQLPMLLKGRLREHAASLTTEIERLTALARDRENMHRGQIERLESKRDEARLLASHARRVGHQLEGPAIALPLHVAERPREGVTA